MNYRGRNGRTTDGDQVWQHTKREHVSSPPGYVPPTVKRASQRMKPSQRLQNAGSKPAHWSTSYGVFQVAALLFVAILFTILMVVVSLL